MKKTLLFTTILFSHIFVFGQEKPKIVPASPEAASLAKFINFPVGYNTGVPNINIPLLEIKVGEINLPISLSYHAGGIKVNEKSTWVGLGWQLSAEPEITRAVNGNDDFSNAGYLGTSSKANDPSYTRTLSYLKSMVNGSIDEEPDEFYYKLADKSGKFYFHRYLNNTTKAFPLPYNQLNIQYDKDNTRFQILDESGMGYRFGNSLSNTQALEFNQRSDIFNISSWKCTEMISPSKKDTVSFSYSAITQNLDYSIQEKYIVYDDVKDTEGYAITSPEMWALISQGILTCSYSGGYLSYWRRC